ncbi:MAG TPA: sugar phosphate isomerase/epimerase family protein [Isosphaeraceae bacterium]|nr:sugar phosphate isomerase/epimerase family protein [Isosphaeraceae bacterium]
MSRRLLGTMITYGCKGLCLDAELDLAQRLGAEVLEILPDWRALPDAGAVRQAVADRGLQIHSAHGCWGGRAIKASRVDLGETDAAVYRESADDLKRCIDWLQEAGGTFLVVHPGGLSSVEARAARRACLGRGLTELADHAEGSRVVVCVENMPPGVHPGSLMGELFELLGELDRPGLALALDTGHAHLSADLCAETAAAGSLLVTTHVHDNDGRRDTHDAPGRGTIDWVAWASALDRIGYHGPIMLECIRQLREDPGLFCPEVLAPLTRLPSSTGPAQRIVCSE